MATLIVRAKLNAIDLQASLADVLTRIADRDSGHAAHETHWPGLRMLLDEGEGRLGISAKMPMAFF